MLQLHQRGSNSHKNDATLSNSGMLVATNFILLRGFDCLSNLFFFCFCSISSTFPEQFHFTFDFGSSLLLSTLPNGAFPPLVLKLMGATEKE